MRARNPTDVQHCYASIVQRRKDLPEILQATFFGQYLLSLPINHFQASGDLFSIRQAATRQ